MVVERWMAYLAIDVLAQLKKELEVAIKNGLVDDENVPAPWRVQEVARLIGVRYVSRKNFDDDE